MASGFIFAGIRQALVKLEVTVVTAVSRTAETLVAPYSVLTDAVVATIGNQLALVYVYGTVDPGEALVAGAGVVADHVGTRAVHATRVASTLVDIL